MPELHTDQKTRQQPFDSASAVSQLPPTTIARRRRLLRWSGVMAVLLCLGLSAIPSPKGSSQTTTAVVENGVKTQVQRFFFSRHIGLPFQTGRADYNDDGSIKDITIHGDGFLGNFVVAFLIVIGASILIGRRRRDD